MSNSVHSHPPARSWRDIEQSIAPRAMSSEGRKRLLVATVKSMGVLFVLCFAGWGACELWSSWETNPNLFKAPVKSAPVKTIVLKTDGVLDQSWVARTLALPKTIGLMEVDLYALQARLLATGQVRSAVLARKFPDTVSVILEERSPVARIMAQAGDEPPKAYLVARDGVVFAGINHDPALLNTLPYLDGVALKRVRGSFRPIEGMEIVADLLGTAHANIPALYRGWQVVSLERLATDGEIMVRSKDVREITFGTREDFFRQVAQLDLIIEEARQQADSPPLRAINLSIGGIQVPVAFETPVAPVRNQLKTAPAAKPVAQPVATPHAVPQRPVLFTVFNPSSREL